jgi:hypothetical protein
VDEWDGDHESQGGGGYEAGCYAVYDSAWAEYSMDAVVLWVGEAGGGVSGYTCVDGDGGVFGLCVGKGRSGSELLHVSLPGLVGVCDLSVRGDGVSEWVDNED